jgi:predicted dehydrogenase
MDTLRAALVGYGLAGRVFHAPLLTAAGLTVTCVVTRNPERTAQVGADLPAATVVAGVDDLWAKADDYDLVVVASDNASHAPVARAALAHGLPVVVDKPLAVTAEDAADLVRRAEQAGVLLTVFHNRRWDSDQLTLSALIRAGVLGEVLRHESRFERWRPELTANKWRETSSAAEGGGTLLDLGSHLIDQAVVLFGPVAHVYAEVEARRGGADDDIFIALTHEGGVSSHLWAGAMTAAPGPRRRVLGTRAAYVVEDLDGQEEALRAGLRPADDTWGVEGAVGQHVQRGDDREQVHGERGRWDLFYPAVAAALIEGGPPPVDPHDAVTTLALIEAARRSAATRSVVVPTHSSNSGCST